MYVIPTGYVCLVVIIITPITSHGSATRRTDVSRLKFVITGNTTPLTLLSYGFLGCILYVYRLGLSLNCATCKWPDFLFSFLNKMYLTKTHIYRHIDHI